MDVRQWVHCEYTGLCVVALPRRISAGAARELCDVLAEYPSVFLRVPCGDALDDADLDSWLALDIAKLSVCANGSTDWAGDHFVWRYLARTTTVVVLECVLGVFAAEDMAVAHTALAANRSVAAVYVHKPDVCASPSGMRAFARAIAARPWPIGLFTLVEGLVIDSDELAAVFADMLRSNTLATLYLRTMPASAEFANALAQTTSLAFLRIDADPGDPVCPGTVGICKHGKHDDIASNKNATVFACPYIKCVVQCKQLSSVQKAVFCVMLIGRTSHNFYVAHRCHVSATRLLHALDSLPDVVDSALLETAMHNYIYAPPADQPVLLHWIQQTIARVQQKQASTPADCQ